MGLLRKSLNWYARLSPARGKVSPPYRHVVQIGDPRLRRVSVPVPPEDIKMEEVQKVIQMLNYVMNKHGSVGMAAPQIGVNWRIFVMRCTNKQVSKVPPELINSRRICEVPHTVYINPKLKVVDFQKVVHTEGCESMKGYAADVPRYKAVELSGLDAQGEPIVHQYTDWAARIAQHELEHLDGKLFLDHMDRKTLHCICWEEVNISQGKVVIPFTPE